MNEHEGDVVMRDGSTVHVRPVGPADEADLLAFLRALSNESRVARFFGLGTDLAREARREINLDYRQTFGLLATAGVPPRVVGHALYVLVRANSAEVALEVADEYQGRGLGTILIGQLAEVAAANGVHIFEAVVLPTNYRMIDVFRQIGYPVEVHTDFDQIQVSFPTSLTAEALDRFDRREQIAAASALRAVLQPRSVAVIGASRQRGTMGAEVLHNLLVHDFNGPVYAVNPAAEVVQCLPAYPSVEAIPGPVDLAIVAVPAARVLEVAEQCGRKGVRALVVFAAGFAEVNLDGQARQAELLRICRSSGMRLVGPNGVGLLNTAPGVRLDAIVGPPMPPPGRIAFASQSNTLGQAVLEHARARGLGISSFVAIGNKADISSTDLLNYWECDPETDVILLYVESFGNPRKFSRVARRVAACKPIVATKSGRSAVGATAGSSRTAALLAASDVTVDGLFRQAGVIRTDTFVALLDVAALLVHQPLPAGRRVGIVGNVHGPAILCADACRAEGLEVATLDAETTAGLRPLLERELEPANPATLHPLASAIDHGRALRAFLADSNVDAVIVIFVPPIATRPEDVAHAIAEVAAEPEPAQRKPVLAVFMSSAEPPLELRSDHVRVPVYAFPESAAIALAHVAHYAAWRQRPADQLNRLADVRRDEAVALVAVAVGRGGGWLSPADVECLLGCYGLRQTSQQPLPRGVELVVGMVHDKQFGPVLVCGGGGTLGELFRDVVVRLSPLSRQEAAQMIRELKTYPLLNGFAGHPTCDVAALEELLLRIGALVEDLPQVAELDCSPVLVHAAGASIVEARVRIEAAAPERPLGAR